MQNSKYIRSYIDSHRDEMLATLADLVNTPSQVCVPEAANKLCEKLKILFVEAGLACETFDVGPDNAKAILGVWGADRPGAPVLFSGHYDTVTLPGEHPFSIDENGHARGLGCLDMKGGIVIALYVVKALQSIGWTERPVKFLFLGDEEIGHLNASTPELIMEQSRGSLCAFNMETGRLGNPICVARKGGGNGHFTVKGVGAHSGADFLKGRNAVVEMAHKILDIEALTDLQKGTTVSSTIIRGGSIHNGIPDECTLNVNTRFENFAERERLVTSMREIAAKTYIDGCSTAFEHEDFMPPFEATAGGLKLAGFVSSVSEEIGMGKMETIRLGGSSDASYITMVDVPTVCAMGIMGEFHHTDREYAIVDSLYERTELLANVVSRINEFANL